MSVNRRKRTVAIIDYKMSNLFSVEHACRYVGLTPVTTTKKDIILKADGVILPGMGAFGDAMNNLQNMDLIEPIIHYIQLGKPFLGICLGMQLLFSESEEFGLHKGLDIIKGRVVKLKNNSKATENLKIPHVGWNRIYTKGHQFDWNNTLLRGVKVGEFMYFVHSYHAIPDEINTIASVTKYGNNTFCSSVSFGNIFATQYHPEKSGKYGLLVYKNFKNVLDTRYNKL